MKDNKCYCMSHTYSLKNYVAVLSGLLWARSTICVQSFKISCTEHTTLIGLHSSSVFQALSRPRIDLVLLMDNQAARFCHC